MTTFDSITITAPDFLSKIGHEFGALASEVEQLQDTISDLLKTADAASQLLVQAQALDYVFQHMTELGAIISAAADQSSPLWRLPAGPLLDNVSLSGLAARLSGRNLPPPICGEFEMY